MKERINKSILGFGLSGGILLLGLALFSQTTFESRVQFSLQSGQYITQQQKPPLLPQMTHATKNAEVKIETLSCSPGSWMLIFHFPEPVEFKNEIEEGQLYLEFNQAIDSKDFLTAQDKISTLIKRVSNGYHTLLFEARRPLIYQMESSGSVFYLHLIPDLNAPLEMTKQSKVAFARLLIEKRAYQAAFQQLKRLMQEYPDDKDLWILYSTLEGLLPKWIKQVEILRELHLKNPLDEDIETLMYEAFSPHSSYVLAQRQMQRTISIAAVQVYLLEGEKMIHCFPDHVTYFGSQYQVWDGHVSSIVNSSGQAVGFKQWRNRGAFYLRNDWRNGDSLKLSFYGQEGALGAGLEYKTLIPFLQGSIFTDLQWHRPSWEVFEALAFSGREDRLFSQIESVYNRYLSWSLGGGARRIGISGTPDGFTSALADAGLYLNLVIPNPIFGLNYSLNAEYVLARESKIGVDGIKFFPVPYTSFENHTFQAYLIYIYRSRWYISAYAGETFNRLGLNDWTLGAELRYAKPLPCGWEIKFSYNRFPSTIISGATSEFLTGSFMIRF